MSRPVKPQFTPPAAGQAGFGRAASQALLDLPTAMRFLDDSNAFQMSLFDSPNDALIVDGDKAAQGISLATARRPLFVSAAGNGLTALTPDTDTSFVREFDALPAPLVFSGAPVSTPLTFPEVPAAAVYGLRYSFAITGTATGNITWGVYNSKGEVVATSTDERAGYFNLRGGSGTIDIQPIDITEAYTFRLSSATGATLTFTRLELFGLHSTDFSVKTVTNTIRIPAAGRVPSYIPSNDGVRLSQPSGSSINSNPYTITFRYTDGAQERITGYVDTTRGVTSEVRPNFSGFDNTAYVGTLVFVGELDETTYMTSAPEVDFRYVKATGTEGFELVPSSAGSPATLSVGHVNGYRFLEKGSNLFRLIFGRHVRRQPVSISMAFRVGTPFGPSNLVDEVSIDLGANRIVKFRGTDGESWQILCSAFDGAERVIPTARPITGGIFFITINSTASPNPGSSFSFSVGAFGEDDYDGAFAAGNGYESTNRAHPNHLASGEHVAGVGTELLADGIPIADPITITPDTRGSATRIFDLQVQSGDATAIIAGAAR